MKNLYIFFLVLFFNSIAFGSVDVSALRIKQAVKSGEWSDPGVWENGTLPVPGDNIIIPSSCHISISDLVDFSINGTANIIYLHGRLVFDANGKLRLPAGSIINVETEGSIENYSNGGSFDRIRIGSSIYYTANDGPIKGPLFLRKNSSPTPFINFSVALDNKKILVQWITLKPFFNTKFELQRNISMDRWETITRMASAVTKNKINTYSFIDKDKSAIIANYRLKIIEEGGDYTYTKVRSVRHSDLGPTLSIESCTSGNMVLHFSQQISSLLIFRLENLSGKCIRSKKIKHPIGDVNIKMRNIPPGNYMATVTGPMGFRYMQPVIL